MELLYTFSVVDTLASSAIMSSMWSYYTPWLCCLNNIFSAEHSHHLVYDHKTTPTSTKTVLGAPIQNLFGTRLLLETLYNIITASQAEKQLIEQE